MSKENKKAGPVKLGKYTIKSKLGHGTMGIVYKGFDPLIERAVALKTIRKDLLDSRDSDELLVRFRREAQAAGRLNHPNIVAVYEYDEDGDTVFIAMEFVQGRSLKSFFDNNERFDIADIVQIMSQILGALSYAHENGVVHRDIKPANIILTDNGEVKITDFGIAHVDSSNLTQTGMIMGTPNFMSPEQFMGQNVDGRSDLFSAGVLLYQFIAGENPFHGRNMATIMHNVLKSEPVEPADLNFNISPELSAVIKKSIAKKPNERFQNAKEFFNALKQALQNDPSKIQFPHDIEDDLEPGATVIPRTPPQKKTDLPKPSGSSGKPGKDLVPSGRFKWVFAGVFIAFVIAGVILFQFSKSPETDSHIKPEKEHIEPVKPEPPDDAGKEAKEHVEPVKSAGAESEYRPDYSDQIADNKNETGDSFQSNKDETTDIPDEKTEPAKVTFEYVIAELKELGKDKEPDFFEVWTNKQDLYIGEEVSYHFQSEKDCYLNLFNFTVSGELIQVFPNNFSPDSFVEANKEYSIPDAGINLVLNVTGPSGIENIIALVSEEPLNILDADFETQDFFALDRNNQELLNTVSKNIRESSNLAQKQIQYSIQE